MNYRTLIMEINIEILEAHSLKDKRQLRLRLVNRLKARFNLSVSEVGSHDIWNRLELAIAYIAINQATAEHMRDTISQYLDDEVEGRAIISEIYSEII